MKTKFFLHSIFFILFTKTKIHSHEVAINQTSQVDAMILCMVCALFLFQILLFFFCRIEERRKKNKCKCMNTTKNGDDGCSFFLSV